MKLFKADISAYCAYANIEGLSVLRLLFMRYFYVILLIRLQSLENKALILIKFISKVFLSMFFNIEIASKCKIGPGLILPHPQNVIIGAASIGSNCTIMANVTIGAKLPDPSFTDSLRPNIGSNVLLGVSSCVIGAIKIGDNCKVGALTLVSRSVGDDKTIVGHNVIID
jgi:serine O-acetyltransferase